MSCTDLVRETVSPLGVDADVDGVCDDVDDCVGAYDECGVCNGPGPDWPVVESVELFFDSVYIEQIDFWYVFQTGADTTFTFVCSIVGCTDATAENFDPDAVIDDGSCYYGPEECGGVSTITYNNDNYELVAIGSQCWFAENLRTAQFANGDTILGELTDGEWPSITYGAQAVYGGDDAYLLDFGRLYNWYAVDDPRGLCPSGWHVPTDGEYNELTAFLGGSNVAGDALKSSPLSEPSWDGTNVSGFSALPGGYRSNVGVFANVGSDAYFWSSSVYGSYAWSRQLNTGNAVVGRYSRNLRNGFAVRCVQDAALE